MTTLLIALLFAIPSPNAIRTVDFREVVSRQLHLDRVCRDAKPFDVFDVEYGDLTGDWREEAVVDAGTCRARAGAVNFAAVYAMSWKGQPAQLEISTGDRDPEDLYAGRTETPRLAIIDGKLVQSYVIGVTRRAWARHKTGWTRVITYKWTGETFVIDTIEDQPPQEGEGK